MGAGSTFAEVTGKKLANMDLLMPKDFEEQKLTGSFFEKRDRLITLHQRKTSID